jgi:lactoylglutathione lyase
MKIHHVALWTNNLERLRDFYCQQFGTVAGTIYRNPSKGFESYFLAFERDVSLELMRIDSLGKRPGDDLVGWAHLALAVENPDQVDGLVERLRESGVVIAGEPRRTGDGYYEAVILDPDGNRVEIVSEGRL